MEGAVRFLARVWRLICEETESGDWIPSPVLTDVNPDPETVRALAKTTAKVTEDIENLQMNTAISALMILVNHLTGLPKRPRKAVLQLSQLLAPFAPHLAEEVWSRLGGEGLVSLSGWPTFRPEDLVDTTIELPIQINSKVKGKIQVSPSATRDEIEAVVRKHPDLPAWSSGKDIEKFIIVPGRIVNCICP